MNFTQNRLTHTHTESSLSNRCAHTHRHKQGDTITTFLFFFLYSFFVIIFSCVRILVSHALARSKFIVAVLVQFAAASSAVTRLASVPLVFVVKYFVNLFLICNKFSQTHTHAHIQWQHINTYYVKRENVCMRERERESESCVSGETVRCVRVAFYAWLRSWFWPLPCGTALKQSGEKLKMKICEKFTQSTQTHGAKAKVKSKAQSHKLLCPNTHTHALTHMHKSQHKCPVISFQPTTSERALPRARDTINKSVAESFWNERERERSHPSQSHSTTPQSTPPSPLHSPCLPRVIATGSTCCHSDCRTKRFARFAAGATKSTRLDSSFATRRALSLPHNLFTVARENNNNKLFSI